MKLRKQIQTECQQNKQNCQKTIRKTQKIELKFSWRASQHRKKYLQNSKFLFLFVTIIKKNYGPNSNKYIELNMDNLT